VFNGYEHPDVAATYNIANISTNVFEKPDTEYEEALDIDAKSLEINTRVNGSDNYPKVTSSHQFISLRIVYVYVYQNFAVVCLIHKNQERAKEMARRKRRRKRRRRKRRRKGYCFD
jgi:hypothetical protein